MRASGRRLYGSLSKAALKVKVGRRGGGGAGGGATDAARAQMREGGTRLFDVRSADEIAASGGVVQLGKTVAENLPLPEIEAGALRLAPGAFEAKFGFAKPLPGDVVVMSCKA